MATTTTLQPRPGTLVPGQCTNPLPAIPWADPHSVPPEKLAEFIASLQQACAENPDNADLHTCLGMAHAMNYDVYRSMDALEGARRIEPENFLAQFKYAELYYRLRALDKAEVETKLALELAGTPYMRVFQIVGATAFIAYSLALCELSIWYRRSWGLTLKACFDGLIYGLLTAGTFGWLWPR